MYPSTPTPHGAPPPLPILPFYQAEIRRLEGALDRLWPNWRHPDRSRRRFDHVEYDLKAAIKWLLKRHSLLSRGSSGRPDPLDQPVLVVKDGSNPQKCYAHPIIPDPEGKAWRLPVPTMALYALGGPPYPGRECVL